MITARQRQGGVLRLGLLGAECSGKTTLAAALAEELPAYIVGEELRDFVDEHGRTPRQDEQQDLFRRQVAAEDAAARDCQQPWLVADPAPVMTAVYSREYFADDSLLATGLDHAETYDLLVWCAPVEAWEPDGLQRDGPWRQASTEAILAELLASPHGIGPVPVLRVDGSLQNRLTGILDAIDGALS